MQTFLPYPDFQRSAECLDKKRCWKQVVEAHIILNILAEKGGQGVGWKNHPATRMWRGYEAALTCYYNVFWTHCVEFHKIKVNKLQKRINLSGPTPYPVWFGYPGFHASHRSNLLRKDQEFYGKFGWTEKNNLEYLWPICLDFSISELILNWKKEILQNQSIINQQVNDGLKNSIL